MLLLLLAACPLPEDDPKDSAGEDTSAACGSTQGFAYGTVTGPYSSDPNPRAVVWAVAPDDGREEAEMAGDGTYELNLEAGGWTVFAEADGCYSDDHELSVTACGEYPVDIALNDCDVADKPNLYLYPERDTPTSVRLFHTDRQRIVASDPAYGRGWRGVAHPDGTFTAAGERAPFLFYEVSLQPWQSRAFQRVQGWCLPEAGAVEAMAELLGAYGFTARERVDFVEGWEHDLPPSESGYAVYPQLSVDAAADVEITPSLPLDRLWLVVEDGAGCAALPPVVTPFSRRGAHAVEWGVVLHALVR